MKILAIYSGKGGVGKTTTSALLSLALAKKHKVALLDTDLNFKGSIPVMFEKGNNVKNLTIFSVAYESKKHVLMGGVAKRVLSDLADKVIEANPDICIIDMPPGATESHLEIFSRLKPSSFILVIQPNKLSEVDAIKATEFFIASGVPVSGIIKNMEGEVFGEANSINVLNLPTLATIPLNKEIAHRGSAGTLSELKENPFNDICEDLFVKATDVRWVKSKTMLSEFDVSQDSIFDMIDKGIKVDKFVNLTSWEHIREHLIDTRDDAFLSFNDTSTIKRMLNGLNESGIGMFMVLKPPNTEIKLFSGEVGLASLDLNGNKSYYNVPRVNYKTDKGEVTLFPHEVSPVTSKLLMELESSGELMLVVSSATPRYVPPPKLMEEIISTFGNGTHGWKEEYIRMGVK